MRYMLDTNICIYLIKQQPKKVLVRMHALNRGDAVMSVVTYAELCAGIEIQSPDSAHDKHVLALLTERIQVLPFPKAAAVAFGVLRAATRERNRDTMDRLIAAHAVSSNLILVTNNENDFKGYPGLTLENWI
jgi:tRNA(fMet)-specific endonuclease VapC